MKKFFTEFKEFAFKGNIVDLAVAVVMGAAFGAVVTGFVNHIINPIIGAIAGQYSLASITLGVVQIGAFINVLIDFIIKALAIFVALKAYNTANKLRAKEEKEESAAVAVVEVDEKLETLKEILAELKKR